MRHQQGTPQRTARFKASSQILNLSSENVKIFCRCQKKMPPHQKLELSGISIRAAARRGLGRQKLGGISGPRHPSGFRVFLGENCKPSHLSQKKIPPAASKTGDKILSLQINTEKCSYILL